MLLAEIKNEGHFDRLTKVQNLAHPLDSAEIDFTDGYSLINRIWMPGVVPTEDEFREALTRVKSTYRVELLGTLVSDMRKAVVEVWKFDGEAYQVVNDLDLENALVLF